MKNRSRVQAFIIFIALIIAFIAIFYGEIQQNAAETISTNQFSEKIFIIDPGHGGEDGGAASKSGTAESAINLDISKRLDMLLAFYGASTQMTRHDDSALHDEGISTVKGRKTSDLKNRAAFINSVPNAVLISIHQNFFPQSKYCGMQVFFGRDDASIKLAQNMQENVGILNPENTRQAMKIQDSVYLMKHVTCPAVLVECGFLSNPSDAQKLETRSHQIKVSMTIAAACITT